MNRASKLWHGLIFVTILVSQLISFLNAILSKYMSLKIVRRLFYRAMTKYLFLTIDISQLSTLLSSLIVIYRAYGIDIYFRQITKEIKVLK